MDPEPEIVVVPIVGPTAPEPVQRVQPILIVQPVTPAVPFSTKNEPELAPKRIREELPKQFGNNSPKNSESELFPNSFEPDKSAPEARARGNMPAYKKIGQVGRKRKYELPGNRGEIPVKEVVLFRYIKHRHWPGMSDDMKQWYEQYYFKKPNRAERARDAEDYERHVKSWERGQRWIAEYEASRGQATVPLGDSRKIVSYRKRASS